MANIINGTDTGSGGLITTGDSSDELQLQTAEVARVTLTNTAVVVNESGADVDFRVEGDTDANLLFVDAGNDRVGIGTSSPAQKLDVSGQLKVINGGDGFFINPNASDTRLVTSGTLPLTFRPNDTERMSLTSDGYLRMASGSGGIQFNGDTAAANALDDYEQGTWTPAWSNGGGSPTYTAASTVGSYTKIGNMCAAWGVVTSSALTQSANGVHITLPLTVKNQQSSYGAISIFPEDGINPAGGAGNMYGITVINVAAFSVFTIASGTGNNYTALTFNDLQASAQTRIRFCVVFEVA